jgi:hypothetical protein
MAHVAKALAMTTAALVLAGCAAASGTGSPPGGSPTGPSGTPAPSTGTGAGLRGQRVAAVDCAVSGLEPAGTVGPLPTTPAAVVICPGGLPDHGRPVTLAPVPGTVRAALALADPQPPSGSGVVCAMYADAPRPVYARLADGAVYRLWVPQDQACHHYVPSVVRLLDSYLPVGPLPPATPG